MSALTCIENYITQEKHHFSSFLIEPLEIGQGITLGTALRRTLLSDLTGCSITGARINDIEHEFETIDGLREDTLELLLNLKQIIFRSPFSSFHSMEEKKKNKKLKGVLNVKGPLIVTAGMFYLPKNTVTILNPNQYICTLISPKEFYLEIDIEKGKGYKLSEEVRKEKEVEKINESSKGKTLLVDALFMPIRKVNYKIKLIHDTLGNIKESLNLEITTNGSITPKRAIQESLKLLLHLIYPVFLSPLFSSISAMYSKKIFKKAKKREKISETVLPKKKKEITVPTKKKKEKKSN
jgi:DNA-directed RNA polymerase subunit alpha